MAAVANPNSTIRKETGNAVLEIENSGGKAEKFVCQFNPGEYTISAEGSIESFKTIGSQKDTHQVSVGNAQILRVHLQFDSASIREVTDTGGGKVEQTKDDDISPYMNMLLSTLEIEGKIHQPPSVRFVWGSVNFLGKVKDIEIRYTAFASGGKPVRSEVDLSIMEDGEQEKRKRESPKNSPDRTKNIVLTQDRSLRGIARTEYGDASEWRRIARANGVMNPADVPVGTRLIIPAMEQE
ncbi:MAG: hypothetical protein IJ679_12960 [Lachnospiraceae bacterium]|nr:hypothetical protein [Lachnospiraceae bacterium]